MPARRSPRANERKRDPERSRERILDAALVEFSRHGFAGARTSAIARRAAVNQQLISYYFDGKAGLFLALTERWHKLSAELNPSSAPLAEVVDNFVHASVEHRHWTRLLVWEGLTRTGQDDTAQDEPLVDDFFPLIVDDMRRRQAAGELGPDLDPAYVLLLLFAAAAAPVVLPQVAQRMTGKAANSADFLDAYRQQLRRVVERLGR
jgi:TetR/AcrR family transcriptional regulator